MHRQLRYMYLWTLSRHFSLRWSKRLYSVFDFYRYCLLCILYLLFWDSISLLGLTVQMTSVCPIDILHSVMSKYFPQRPRSIWFVKPSGLMKHSFKRLKLLTTKMPLKAKQLLITKMVKQRHKTKNHQNKMTNHLLNIDSTIHLKS